MFYVLMIACVGTRIFVSVLCVYIAQYLNVTLTLYPAVLKMCIGFVQIAVMFEISVRVNESVHQM